jgi:hypothetical protein
MTADQQAQATKRLAAALRDGSGSTLVRLALADYAALMGQATAATDARVAESLRLRLADADAEVARLKARVTKLAKTNDLNHHRMIPCKSCHEPMLARSARAGIGCRACYVAKSKLEHAALAAAVAAVNADPNRPTRVMDCWAVVGEMVGKALEAARSMGGRSGLVVVPRKEVQNV